MSTDDPLLTELLGKPVWMWASFLLVVIGLLALDLGVLHRRCRTLSMREAALGSVVYILLGLGFGFWIWTCLGETKAYAYWTGFVVEKTLAMDNLFVIATIFSYFAIPRQYQHRVLFWGVLGVILLRGLMIGAGAALVSEFEWVLYLFAAFLALTGVKLILTPEAECDGDLSQNRLLRFLRRRLRVSDRLHGEAFFVRLEDTRISRALLHATPLFLALVLIEVADVVFALDSIPAVFTITTDTYIVYTSNIFAILGLRALFFVLIALMDRLQQLKFALGALLVFIGSKQVVADALGLDHFPQGLSLAITFAILTLGAAYSLWVTRAARRPREPTRA